MLVRTRGERLQPDRAAAKMAAPDRRPRRGLRGCPARCHRAGAAHLLRPGCRDRVASRPAGVRACYRHLARRPGDDALSPRSEEHTSELQSLMRISYAVFCLKKKK